MCSICGSTRWDDLSHLIWQKSKDRGRDDAGTSHRMKSWIGNRRATPTTEVIHPIERQPVGDNPKIVFNGIISNDKELGVKEGEADTSILPRVLDFSSLGAFRNSLQDKIIGSYAIAVLWGNGEIWLACNYKPIWIAEKDGVWYFSSLKAHFPPSLHPFRMPPYSVCDLPYSQSLDIERVQSNKALVICSSGLDSTAVAAFACYTHGKNNTTLLHFDYGCKATMKEQEGIKKISQYLQCNHIIQSMPTFGGSNLFKNSKEQISFGIAGAEFAHEWVPARNLVMLSLAVSMAEALGFGYIYLGTNLEEAGAYPDNEEQFILDFDNLLVGAVQNGVKIKIVSPLGGLMKHEIIPFGQKYNAPFHLTWSCYKEGQVHCGVCGPCFMRKIAFERNGMKDPVSYE